MFKKLSKSQKWLNRLTWVFTTLAIILITAFLLSLISLSSTLLDRDSDQFPQLISPRSIAQLQREILRLQNIVGVDGAINTPFNDITLQRNLIESRFNILDNNNVSDHFDDELTTLLQQSRTDWDAMQPYLDALQADPQNMTLRSALVNDLAAMELLANESVRIQSGSIARQQIYIEDQLSTRSLLLAVNSALGIGAMASALGLYALIQQQKRKVTEELAVRKQRLQTIVKTIPDAILRIDYTGHIIDYEPNELTDLGIPPLPSNASNQPNRPVVGRKLEELVRPQLAQTLHKKLQTAFTTNKSVRHEFWLDRDNDGNRAWFQAFANPINETEAIVAIRDITEDRQHRAAVQKAQRMESLGMMAGGVGHDFGNTLATIRMNASLLIKKSKEQENTQKHTSVIIQSVKQAEMLSKQLIAYAGQSKLEVKQIDLNHFLDEHDAIIRATVTVKRAYTVVQAEELPLIAVDEWQLQQMLMNLVINAKETTENGTGCITVRTATADLSDDNRPPLIGGVKIGDGRYVTLEVEDNGAGISPYMHERIFEPYFSTHEDTHSGLGLSATLGMIRSHSGGIELQSVVGEGTTFRLYFPAAPQK